MKATSQTDLTAADRYCPPCSGKCHQGRRCPGPDPQTFATTEPGDLAPQRERKPVNGAGIVLAIVAVLGAAAASQLLYALAQLVGRP